MIRTLRLDVRLGPSEPFLTNRFLRYAPTREWIFPSPIEMGPQIGGGAPRWFLYYSPHDAPGGICLATAHRLEGPWAEHPGNPLIRANWPGAHAVSHVASPHPLWLQDERRLLLYYHGENGTTRWAESCDGITFTPGGVALDTSAFDDPTVTEVSYARVVPHRLPSRPSSRFAMLMMVNHMLEYPGVRHLHLAWSDDGRHWHARQEAVVSPPAGWQASGPQIVRLDGIPTVLHHLDIMNGPGHLCATPLNEDLRALSPPHLLLNAGAEKRLADPFLAEEDGASFLFCCAGPRLAGSFVRRRVGMLGWRQG